MDGTEDRSGPQEDPWTQSGGDGAETALPRDQDQPGTEAPLEQQLAPIVLEGEQVPATDVEGHSEPTDQADAVPAATPAGNSPVEDASPDAGASDGPADPAGDAGSPVDTEATPTEPLRAEGAVDMADQPSPVDGTHPSAPEGADAPWQHAESGLDVGPVAAASASAAGPEEAPATGVTDVTDDVTGAVDAPGDGAAAAAPPLDLAADAGGPPPAPGAASAPVLPPPPPELADVPADAGRLVSGRVREVRGDDVLVDLDDGRVGVINRRNLGGEGEPASVVSPGDAIEGAVLARSDPQHRVVLSRTWALKKRAWEAVSAAAAENRTLTGTVVSVSGKGAVVDVGVRGFVPASHLELGPVSDPQRYAGQELTLRILDIDADRERLVLSRRSVLLKEQRRSAHDALSNLQPGQVRRGKVASLSEYGAFVDIGGVTGLVHLSELSWHRVRHPSDVLSVGQEVDVKVLDVKVKKRRVGLSIRQLTDDPLSGLQAGEIRTGPVTRLVDFGAFVDLAGVEGLVHLSELAEYRVSAPEEIVAPGEQVRVKVLSVDHKRRRIELSIRQAAEYGG